MLKTTVSVEIRRKTRERKFFSLDYNKKKEDIYFIIDEDKQMNRFVRYILSS
jgi:hypothetical protein